MTQEDILMYIGMIVVAFFVLYMIARFAKIQRNVVEGLTNNKNSDKSMIDVMAEGNIKELKSLNQKLDDSLRIDKYRKDYEDMLIDLDDYINGVLLREIAFLSNDIKDTKETNQMIETIPRLNELYKFKENLNTTMDYIDSKGSSLKRASGAFSNLF